MKTSKCKKCGNLIAWFMVSGKWQAVDAELVELGDFDYDASRHGNHWSNCKKAAAPRGYIKPEEFTTHELTPEEIEASPYLRAIPVDEEERISNLVNKPR